MVRKITVIEIFIYYIACFPSKITAQIGILTYSILPPPQKIGLSTLYSYEGVYGISVTVPTKQI